MNAKVRVTVDLVSHVYTRLCSLHDRLAMSKADILREALDFYMYACDAERDDAKFYIQRPGRELEPISITKKWRNRAD